MQCISDALARFWIFLSTSELIGLRKDDKPSFDRSPRRHRLRVEKAS